MMRIGFALIMLAMSGVAAAQSSTGKWEMKSAQFWTGPCAWTGKNRGETCDGHLIYFQGPYGMKQDGTAKDYPAVNMCWDLQPRGHSYRISGCTDVNR